MKVKIGPTPKKKSVGGSVLGGDVPIPPKATGYQKHVPDPYAYSRGPKFKGPIKTK